MSAVFDAVGDLLRTAGIVAVLFGLLFMRDELPRSGPSAWTLNIALALLAGAALCGALSVFA